MRADRIVKSLDISKSVGHGLFSGSEQEETHRIFKVVIVTIRKWEKQLEEEGNLEKKPLHRRYKKIDPEK